MPLADPITPPPLFDLGASLGQSKAFGSVARHCSAAAVQCLKGIRDQRAYEALGLNWAEFCRCHLALSRSYADKLIYRLEKFGEPYFQLAAIAPIAAESYSVIAPSVTQDGIEIDGEIVPITPENSVRIRQAVDAVRAELRRSRELESDPSLTQLQVRFDAWIEEVSVAARRHDPALAAGAHGLVRYALDKLRRLSASFPPL